MGATTEEAAAQHKDIIRESDGVGLPVAQSAHRSWKPT